MYSKMKKFLFKTLPLIAISAIFLSSCDTEDTLETQELISEEQTLAVIEAETVTDELDNVIDDFFGSIESELGSKSELEAKSQSGREDLLRCAVRTIVITGNEKSVTLDFGDGCETPKGDVLKGIIKMDFEWDLLAKSMTIVKSFENFYFNDISVEGTRTIAKTLMNEDELPESVITFQTKLTWEDGSFAERSGTRTRIFIEGFDTRAYADNVFSIEGNSTTTLSDGTVITSEITMPLIRNMACKFIVSGEKTMVKDGVTHILNFGDGTCDNLATMTVDGETKEIELRRKKRK